MRTRLLFLAFVIGALVSCQAQPEDPPPTLVPTIVVSDITPDVSDSVTATELSSLPQPTATAQSTFTATAVLPEATPTAPNTVEPSPLPTTTPTLTPEDLTPTITPTPSLEPTATYWPTVTRQVLSEAEAAGLVPCQNRAVSGELLEFVTQQYSLPQFYVPADLTELSDYFDSSVTLNQSLFVRPFVIDSLQRMIAEMHTAGLRPSILSAYRSYGEQALAWQWWESQYPGRVAIMSARPGHSEHQLGTTVDFGSPALDHLFHVDFANTAEGVWLSNNAHRFGFTLSYPANTYSITGFKYEPWHFRYVGQEMAQSLFNSGQILTSWQVINLQPACIP
ncbi:MAG: M15 family metallopeptidase [Chloroflexi bacterium]|nr:M15 family metallopeptidase [Chloroflexota bacterium]